VAIDICIDEERFGEVYKSLILRDGWDVTRFFPPNSHSTHNADPDWSQMLDAAGTLPVTLVRTEDGDLPLTNSTDHSVMGWSRLLYAKLIRSHIQEMGTDCFANRLDDTMAYLERNLPTRVSKDPHTDRLSMLYLFELSAASRGYEILGFAGRAWQVLDREQRHKTVEDELYWFYDLLARYNKGVAYFHESRYRQAVMEFNYIISKVDRVRRETKQPGNSEKNALFEDFQGDLFLYVPSVLYRADVQIKLQLAYHALDTLERYFPQGPHVTPRKRVQAELICADANQQMYDMRRSWSHLDRAYRGISDLEQTAGQLGNQRTLAKLARRLGRRPYQGIKGRFIDIFVQDYLTWLETTFEAMTPCGKSRLEPQNTYENALACFRILESVFSNIYSKAVRFNAYNRNGYYQQLAKLLKWLTIRYEREGERLRQSKEGSLEPEFCEMAKRLYLSNREGLMQTEQEKNDRRKAACPQCAYQGIDLKRLGPEHHKWFTDDMLDFYDGMKDHLARLSTTVRSERETKNTLARDKEDFIRRLLTVEREARDDLRITDLELRYKLDSTRNGLPSGRNGRILCWGEPFESRSNYDEAFANLLTCVVSDSSKKDALGSRQYEQIMRKWVEHYNRHLMYRSTHQRHKNGLYFISLQRWNSSSPAQGRSVGGGYLLYKTDDNGTVDLGIAIDPGFDFLRNLFHEGFSLDDIDIVLISHAHADHIRDFESIVILLHELKKRGEKKKKIHVILTLGAYNRLEHIIKDPVFRFFIEPYIIDVHREIDYEYFENLAGYPFKFQREAAGSPLSSGLVRYRPVVGSNEETGIHPKVLIYPTRAYHADSSYSDSFGFRLKVALSETDEVILGYSGDTKWVYELIPDPLDRERDIKDISTQYADCDTVIVHLGSLIGFKKSFDLYNQCNDSQINEECEKLVREANHPYLVGMLRLLSSLYEERDNQPKQLVLIGEFGEELRGGIRVDLIDRLKNTYSERLACLPLDVGMRFQLWPKSDTKDRHGRAAQRVWCVQCENFCDVEEAEFERYGVDEALFCVCSTCHKATPLNVLQDRLRQLYEVGYELRSSEEGSY